VPSLRKSIWIFSTSVWKLLRVAYRCQDGHELLIDAKMKWPFMVRQCKLNCWVKPWNFIVPRTKLMYL